MNFEFCPVIASLELVKKYTASFFQFLISKYSFAARTFFFESFPRKDVTCCRGFPWSAMQFAIGSNLRHMSDKVSIFNAAHPCFLKCILRYETSSTWLYLSKSVANDVLRKEISFLHQICIMREEFSREKNLLPKLLQNKWLLGEY